MAHRTIVAPTRSLHICEALALTLCWTFTQSRSSSMARRTELLVLVGLLSACTGGDGAPLLRTAADSAEAAIHVCEGSAAVRFPEGQIAVQPMKHQRDTDEYAGKGTAAASKNNVTRDNRFVCVVDARTGRGNLVWYDDQPEMYMGLIRRFDL